MATYELLPAFWRDFDALTAEQQRALLAAVRKFVAHLESGRFRKGLRVKGIQGAPGIHELTWAADGRCTFQFGAEVRPGEPHVIWRRCGTHEVLKRP